MLIFLGIIIIIFIRSHAAKKKQFKARNFKQQRKTSVHTHNYTIRWLTHARTHAHTHTLTHVHTHTHTTHTHTRTHTTHTHTHTHACTHPTHACTTIANDSGGGSWIRPRYRHWKGESSWHILLFVIREVSKKHEIDWIRKIKAKPQTNKHQHTTKNRFSLTQPAQLIVLLVKKIRVSNPDSTSHSRAYLIIHNIDSISFIFIQSGK